VIDKAFSWLEKDPLGRITSLFITLILISGIVRVLQGIASKRIDDRSNRYRARKILTGFGYLGFIISILAIFGPNLSNFAVAAGVAGAGVAFALQEVIASIAGYAANSFGGFFRVGDRVQLGGIRGDVIDISVLRTTLMELGEWVNGDLYNGRIVRVANSFVFKEPVFNYSADFPFVWDEIKIPVKYSSDHQLTKDVFLAIATEHTKQYIPDAKETWEVVQQRFNVEKAKLEPMVSLAITDNWVDYTIRYIVAFDKRRVTKNDIFEAILIGVEANSERIQFGSTTLEITSFPEQKTLKTE
jgi:small-conductance mechanosensitive channel